MQGESRVRYSILSIVLVTVALVLFIVLAVISARPQNLASATARQAPASPELLRACVLESAGDRKG